ncbi:FadR/GntR family transcriptional regulator [Kitasatospora sp. SUK 42]|uniref:FadR/GntR family transcriptional regulator n=1 Tax=Kitasatospora sp. SUK 42 TaxID=1588882 RepID=UPI0018C9A52D|nr:FadR/GntR family transcriptional regulator [Kitasatospora sp. SUK 42]MBV2156449.1 FadR family transcriptional regulator [Kitasatospora sp. SUK 42]
MPALRPSPLAEQAAALIEERIRTGEWPVGGRLPGEVALAKELGVGRSTVREALRTLAAAGMVHSRQGSGVFVTSDRPSGGDWATRLRRAELAHVYEVRTMVEVQAARLAAERRTEADLAAVDAALAARHAAGEGDDTAFVDADIALHTTIVAAAHNPVLDDLFAQFAPVLREHLVALVGLFGLREGDPNQGYESHAELVRALHDGDPEAAGRVLAAELEATRSRLLSA